MAAKTKRIWSYEQLLAMKESAEAIAEEERVSRAEAWETAGARATEILALRAKVKRLREAIAKAIDLGDGYAWWNGEGEAFIEPGGYKLLKQTLEET